MAASKLRVLVVDDSALSREVLRRTLETDPRLLVVGEAKTGEEAVKQVRLLQPHLITMDLNMPGMGGLKAIEVLMKERPTPIVVISERSSTSGVDLNYEALSRGALELVPKSAVFGADAGDVQRFVERLRLLAEGGIDEEEFERTPAAFPVVSPQVPLSSEKPQLVGIGSSTGGPRALAKLLSQLPRDLPVPVVIVQHMAEDFFGSFVRFLRDSSGHPVEAANALTTFAPGRIYVAPPRQELFIKENFTAKLLPPAAGSLISPSVDSLFFSMATAFKGRALGVLLTGMGDDGAQGLLRLRRSGSRTIVQDRASCAVFGMPKAAIELGAAEHILDLGTIGPFIAQVAQGFTPDVATPVPVLRQSGKQLVVVVDDHPEDLQKVRGTLERGGYEVISLDNPLMLARTLRRNEVALVVLEPELKTMKSAVVVQTLRSHGLLTPVFLYSDASETTLRLRSKECQAVGTAQKSDPAGFLRAVSRALTPPKT